MVLQLTPQEEAHLIFQKGDSFDIYSAVVTFTGREEGMTSPHLPEKYVKHYFIWDFMSAFTGAVPPDPTSEEIYMNADMPNGPSLLITYARTIKGKVKYHPWGLIHMATRSSGHLWPLYKSPFIRESATMKRPAMKLLSGGQVGLLESFRATATIEGARAEMDEIKSSARSLLYRLASDPERFWSGPNWKTPFGRGGTKL